jgi:hypothetical protein
VELQIDPLLDSQRLNVLKITGPWTEGEAVEGVFGSLVLRNGLTKWGGGLGMLAGAD